MLLWWLIMCLSETTSLICHHPHRLGIILLPIISAHSLIMWIPSVIFFLAQPLFFLELTAASFFSPFAWFFPLPISIFHQILTRPTIFQVLNTSFNHNFHFVPRSLLLPSAVVPPRLAAVQVSSRLNSSWPGTSHKLVPCPPLLFFLPCYSDTFYWSFLRKRRWMIYVQYLPVLNYFFLNLKIDSQFY